ncbi:preprotein translocase subunit YajC [Rubripirellula reticaptiva]|uniref:Sec translocon accessory complex subunit YajC n=1 Tax=Rubripirellula reticaptiva TaxID=2528013 RepID=A0A5C6EKE2_9BACT|nr:preprotein translocase subunit YajC [Rubripirellula reticaptiva]TWU47769.1 preprotein translocase subunit YajC [Rubripirellula reticaptiva]
MPHPLIPLPGNFLAISYSKVAFKGPLNARRCRLLIVRIMNRYALDLQLLAQDAGGGAGAAPAGAAPSGGPGDFLSPFLLPAGLLFLFYFIVIAPERRRKSDEAKLMSAIKKNDRVVTIGGIHAVVAAVSPDSDVVTLRIDENANTRIKVNRSAISRIVTDKETSGKENNSDQSKEDGSNAK